MNRTSRRLLLLTMPFFLAVGCGRAPVQESEEPAPPAEETATPVPETPEPFDTSSITWIVLGDSITEKNAAAQYSYYDYVQDDFHCEVRNYGRSSTGYKIPATYEPFYDRIALIDFTDADVITIFGSFNDLGRDYEFGSADDETTDTLGGCMNRTIENIREAAPDIKIGIATPTPWNLGEGYSSTMDAVLYWGVSQEECNHYVSLLMEVAGKQNVQVLDLYHAGLFDPNLDTDRLTYFNENGRQDHGVHPNSAGHSLMAPLWEDFLLELLEQK